MSSLRYDLGMSSWRMVSGGLACWHVGRGAWMIGDFGWNMDEPEHVRRPGGESIGARPSEKSSQNTGADGTCGEERYQIDFTCAHMPTEPAAQPRSPSRRAPRERLPARGG